MRARDTIRIRPAEEGALAEEYTCGGIAQQDHTTLHFANCSRTAFFSCDN
jgi:hypothetical protein